jgi:hypothetical protein
LSWIESRIKLAESSIEDIYRRLLDVTDKITANTQGLRSANQSLAPPAQGGGGGVYLSCGTTGDLPAGSPGTPLTGQTVWTLSGGVRSNVNTNATIYNDTANDIPAGSQVFVLPTQDANSYAAVSVAC